MGNCVRRSRVVHPSEARPAGGVDRPSRLRIKVRMTKAQFMEMVDRSGVESSELGLGGMMILEECLRENIKGVCGRDLNLTNLKLKSTSRDTDLGTIDEEKIY
uniref:Uncharacterized protein n=1 Tax=Kalanchoe fedtschenkoi TaxID=63787 RepID=A0A7N0ZRQ5_KALFE